MALIDRFRWKGGTQRDVHQEKLEVVKYSKCGHPFR